MNILFLDSWLRDRATGSGSAVAIAGLASGLEALGHSVRVLRPTRLLPSLDLTRLAFNTSLPRRVRALGGRPDLAVGFDIDGFAFPLDAAARYVVALKGVAAEERKFETGWTGARFEVLTRLERRNARRADRVFVTSGYCARAATEAYGLDERRVRIAPEALDDEIRDRAAAATTAGTAAGPGSTRVILSVARQYRRKDTPTLLRAFELVGRDLLDVRLRIVGDGPELPASRALARQLGIADRVTFTGAVSSEAELDREYRQARIFALPSRQEGFGIVFLEAMAYGLPIVAVDAGATPEVAPDGLTSVLALPGDVPGVAAAMRRLLDDPDEAARLGAAGRVRARTFDWPSAAGAFLDGLAD